MIKHLQNIVDRIVFAKASGRRGFKAFALKIKVIDDLVSLSRFRQRHQRLIVKAHIVAILVYKLRLLLLRIHLRLQKLGVQGFLLFKRQLNDVLHTAEHTDVGNAKRNRRKQEDHSFFKRHRSHYRKQKLTDEKRPKADHYAVELAPSFDHIFRHFFKGWQQRHVQNDLHSRHEDDGTNDIHHYVVKDVLPHVKQSAEAGKGRGIAEK